MIGEISVQAFAKINIGLNVSREIKNHFHNIESIFQKINLADTLRIQKKNGTSTCEVFCDVENLPRENTIVKAYNAFQKMCGFALPALAVKIEKKIPSAGGLGGGSSDAASFVFALEKIANYKLSFAEKNEIASTVGSDVFFFLLSENANVALVSGRGEKIEVLDERRDLFFVLIFPKTKCATKKSYALLDEWFLKNESEKKLSLSEMRDMYFSPIENWKFKNDFTKVLIQEYREIANALFALKKNGAIFADVSGSGSTVYGIFLSKENAKSAFEKLQQEWNCYCAMSN